ncbi:MAG: hypothetical protein M3367_07855 [Acidobacteriota bacterium]|nr:hypothetical protein [Acidobacteriota bacterium]
MRYLALSVLFVAFLFDGVQAQSRLDLKNESIKNDLLVENLNDSEMKELKKPSPTTSPFFLRLYSIKELGDDCAPDVETEVACSIRYYLAVTDGSLGVPGAVYDLGEVGEITKIQWLESSNQDIARLMLEISNYPKWAFRYNPKLDRKTRIVEIDVNIDSIKIKVVK